MPVYESASAMSEKRCTRCHETKPRDEFVLKRRGSDERTQPCRECRSAERAKQRRQAKRTQEELRSSTAKRCPRCTETKPLEDFSRSKRTADGHQYYCKPCAADAKRASCAKHADKHKAREFRYRIRKMYGMAVEDLEQMLLDQEGRCAVCRDEIALGDTAAVDHCHATGKVRGVLCRHCNIALGHLRDDPSRVASLHEYIARWKGVMP